MSAMTVVGGRAGVVSLKWNICYSDNKTLIRKNVD